MKSTCKCVRIQYRKKNLEQDEGIGNAGTGVVVLNRVAGVDLIKTVRPEQKFMQIREGVGWKSFLSSRNSKCKGPEVGLCLASLSKSWEASAAGGSG